MAVAIIYVILSSVFLGGFSSIILTMLYNVVLTRLYPIQIPILTKRGDEGIVWDLKKRGQIGKSQKGDRTLKIFRGGETKIPEYSFVSMNRKGADVYPLYEYSKGRYRPLKVSETRESATLMVGNEDDYNWALAKLAENSNRYSPTEPRWLMALKYIAPMSFAVMVIFTIIYFGGKFELMSSNLAGAASQLAVAMERFAGSPPPG